MSEPSVSRSPSESCALGGADSPNVETAIGCGSPRGLEPAARGVSTIEWVFLAVCAVVLVSFRLHAFDLPLETDECNYAYVGARLLEGDRLYVDVWDHQPFGVFALTASVIAGFGDAPEVFRWTATAFSLASLALIFGIARHCGGRTAAAVAAVLFAMASSDPGTAGEGCNREVYMNTFVLAAWYLALTARIGSPWALVASGTLLGLGSTIKTVLAVHWVCMAVWLMCTRGEEGSRGAIRRLAWFALGPTMVWFLSFAYFGATGRFDEFVDAVFVFNLSYAETTAPFFERIVQFFSPPRHPLVFQSALPLWVGSAASLILVLLRWIRSRQASAALILVMTAAGVIAVCLPGRFWPHYYYLLVPPAVLCLAVGLSSVASVPSSPVWCQSRVIRCAAALPLIVLPGWLLMAQYEAYLCQPPFGITVNRYNSRDFWGRAQGEHVRGVTEPGDEIFVFGNEAEIYYYSHRRCASRYTMITGLQNGHSGAERRRETLLAELSQRLPRLIILLFDEPPFDAWKAFLRRHYSEPVGVDYHDRTGKPIMLVLTRKDQPITAPNARNPRYWDWDRSEVGGWFPGDER